MYFPVSPIPKKTNGFTLIEVGIAAILMAALTAGALMLAADQLRTSSAQASGSALATLNTAVRRNFQSTWRITLLSRFPATPTLRTPMRRRQSNSSSLDS
jgi:type II secretory pathway pseudopilin PulG